MNGIHDDLLIHDLSTHILFPFPFYFNYIHMLFSHLFSFDVFLSELINIADTNKKKLDAFTGLWFKTLDLWTCVWICMSFQRNFKHPPYTIQCSWFIALMTLLGIKKGADSKHPTNRKGSLLQLLLISTVILPRDCRHEARLHWATHRLTNKRKMVLLGSLKDSHFNTFLRTCWFNSVNEDWNVTAVS